MRWSSPFRRLRAELPAALGFTLAEDVVVAAAIPATARALRDGWAVASDLTTDAGGYAPAPLPSALRVDVGEPLPPDTDAVALLDAVAIRGGLAQALAPVARRRRCQQVPMSRAAQCCCQPAGASIACTSRCWRRRASRVRVRAPRLRLVGARVARRCRDRRGTGCIADAIAATGGAAASAERGDVASALADAAADAVVVVGGTGSGRNDSTVRTLASVGELHAHGIALIPARRRRSEPWVSVRCWPCQAA